MTVTSESWQKYIDGLRKINEAASRKMSAYLHIHQLNTYEDIQAAIDYAYALATKYGEGAAELACQMYDALSALSAELQPAMPAATATYGEVAKAFRGTMKYSQDADALGSTIGRLVKMAGVDTTMQNALRDGAEWAWIPVGDTCAFCITLASRGWQQASKEAVKNGHAEHVHANCDCTYAVRFNKKTNVQGYDPARYKRIYDNADGYRPQDKINAIRRDLYEANKDEINEQKREAYARRQEEAH